MAGSDPTPAAVADLPLGSTVEGAVAAGCSQYYTLTVGPLGAVCGLVGTAVLARLEDGGLVWGGGWRGFLDPDPLLQVAGQRLPTQLCVGSGLGHCC